MVRPRHSSFLPFLKVCHPACPEPRKEPREGSAFPSSLSASFSVSSVNSVLRETRSFVTTAPSTSLADIRGDFQSSAIESPSPCSSLVTRHSSLTTIPFRIISFAHPHHLTLTESYSYKKQGRGWGIPSSLTLPPFSTTSKHSTHSNASNPNFFIYLPHDSLDTQGVGACPFSLRGSAHSASLRYPFPRLASPPFMMLGGPNEP